MSSPTSSYHNQADHREKERKKEIISIQFLTKIGVYSEILCQIVVVVVVSINPSSSFISMILLVNLLSITLLH